jgi:hypothetical protein
VLDAGQGDLTSVPERPRTDQITGTVAWTRAERDLVPWSVLLRLRQREVVVSRPGLGLALGRR